MAGRNGNDELNRFLLMADLFILLLAVLFRKSIGSFLVMIAILLLVIIYFRMFSKNVVRRRQENGKYLMLYSRVESQARLRRDQWTQRKEYKFFVCPACKTTLRVPRGRGKVKIVCRKCGNSFIGKT